MTSCWPAAAADRAPPGAVAALARDGVWRSQVVPGDVLRRLVGHGLPRPHRPAADARELAALRDQAARGVPDLGLLVEPAAADMPEPRRARGRGRGGEGPRISRLTSRVGAQPVAPRPKTAGGSASTASASR